LIEVRQGGTVLASAAIGRPKGRGRHRKTHLASRIVSEHWKRLTSFSLIGFGVFGLGIIFQALAVRFTSISAVTAYYVQLVLSVQVNFLANLRWTWGDRNAPFWRSGMRYNMKRAAGTLVSLAVYPILVRLGMNYLIANAALVVIFTPANYVLGHWWTFAVRDRRSCGEHLTGDSDLQLECR
jgi:putative flippase GtrA